MFEEFSEILAWLATTGGLIMVFAYFPQIYKIWKRKSSADVSIITYSLFALGVAFWLIYGLSINNLPLIISNTGALIGIGAVIVSCLIYKK